MPGTNTTRGAQKKGSAQKNPLAAKNRYRAVSIVSGKNSCEAVKVIEGKRFLVLDKDVPQIPLALCDVQECACKYSHHEDRRDTSGDRRHISGLRTQLHEQSGNQERRERRGRRKSDWE